MANNRLYLYCKECNRHQYLAKSYGESWSTTPHDSMNDSFIEFVEDHFFCGMGGYSRTVELRWENAIPDQMLPLSSTQQKAQW